MIVYIEIQKLFITERYSYSHNIKFDQLFFKSVNFEPIVLIVFDSIDSSIIFSTCIWKSIDG